MNYDEKISLLNEKIIGLEKYHNFYSEQKNTLERHLYNENLRLTSDEKDAIKIKIFFSEKLEEILGYRIGEARNYIKSLQNPTDSYFLAHATTVVSDAVSAQLHNHLNNFERVSGQNRVTTEIVTARRELISVTFEDCYILP